MRLRTQIIGLAVIATLCSVGIFALIASFQGAHALTSALEERQQADTDLAAERVAVAITQPGEALMAVGASMQPDDLRPDADEEDLRARLLPLVPDRFLQVRVISAGDQVFALPGDAAWQATAPPAAPQLVHENGMLVWKVPVVDDESYLWGRLAEQPVFDALFGQHADERELALVTNDGVAVHDTTGEPARLTNLFQEPIVTRARVLDTGMDVVMYTNAAAVDDLRQQAYVAAAGTAGFVSLAGIGVGAVLARRVATPVSDLSTTVHRIRAGELDARVRPRGAREVRDLGHDVNAMAEALEKDRAGLLELQGDLERTVSKRTAELRQSRSEMEQFFYGVSHDLKGPIIGISQVLDMLRESLDDADPQVLAMAEQARKSANTLQDLVMDLLQFASADRLTLQVAKEDVGALAHDVLETIGATAAQRNVKLHGPAQQVHALIDASVVRRALQNLVTNAVGHMPEARGGEVRVDVKARGRDLVLEVADNGEGIPPELRARLFTPFSSGKKGGSGLGLSIVKRLVEAHRGHVRVDSRTGKGTTFWITIPGVVV